MKRSTELKLLFTLLFLFLITATCTAQQASRKRAEKFQFTPADAVYFVGSGLDMVSSGMCKGCVESNPLYKDAKGKFDVKRNLTVTVAMWGAFKIVEWKFPRARQFLNRLKVVIGGIRSGVGFYNFYQAAHNTRRR
ncbi:MAG: hypothetical protein AB1757_21310 [Acidobacteriota bacterium]